MGKMFKTGIKTRPLCEVYSLLLRYHYRNFGKAW